MVSIDTLTPFMEHQAPETFSVCKSGIQYGEYCVVGGASLVSSMVSIVWSGGWCKSGIQYGEYCVVGGASLVSSMVSIVWWVVLVWYPVW